MLETLHPDVVHYFLAPNVGSAPVAGAEHLARYWRKVTAMIHATLGRRPHPRRRRRSGDRMDDVLAAASRGSARRHPGRGVVRVPRRPSSLRSAPTTSNDRRRPNSKGSPTPSAAIPRSGSCPARSISRSRTGTRDEHRPPRRGWTGDRHDQPPRAHERARRAHPAGPRRGHPVVRQRPRMSGPSSSPARDARSAPVRIWPPSTSSTMRTTPSRERTTRSPRRSRPRPFRSSPPSTAPRSAREWASSSRATSC